jgi:hypothetical protein
LKRPGIGLHGQERFTGVNMEVKDIDVDSVVTELWSAPNPGAALSDAVDALIEAFGEAQVMEAVKEKLG